MTTMRAIVLDAPGQSILVRSGTSSIGMAIAVLARQRGMTVLSTTRNPNKTDSPDDIADAHRQMEEGQATGKLVVVT